MERGETEGSAAHETSPPRYCTHAPALAASRSSRSACDVQNVRAHVHTCTCVCTRVCKCGRLRAGRAARRGARARRRGAALLEAHVGDGEPRLRHRGELHRARRRRSHRLLHARLHLAQALLHLGFRRHLLVEVPLQPRRCARRRRGLGCQLAGTATHGSTNALSRCGRVRRGA